LDARRGVKPTWGEPGNRSPQWRASGGLAESGVFERVKEELLSLTRTRRIRPTHIPPLHLIVRPYVEDASALDDQVDAFNRLLEAVAPNQTRMPTDTDQDFPFAPAGYDLASHRAFSEAWNRRRAREAQEEKARARFARELFTPKDAGEV